MKSQKVTVDFINEWDNAAVNAAISVKQNVDDGTNEEPEGTPQQDHISLLKQLFGYTQFKPIQWKIISSVLNKNDNCAIISSGYGKSLCFQYPSAFTGGVTFIISPFISLMEEQVLSANLAGISACLLNTKADKKLYDEIGKNKYKLIYLSPEFFSNEQRKELLEEWGKTLQVTLIVIDEAHSISSQSHEFRSLYRELGQIRKLIPSAPILAVTSTATKNVINDMKLHLKLRSPQCSSTGFDKENYYFAVFKKSDDSPVSDFEKIMKKCGTCWKFSGPTIVYCMTRETVEEINGLLQGMGVKCSPYHGGLDMKTRKKVQEKFGRDEIDVIVATMGLGRDINKPDVINVIHYGVSDSIEGYYQEINRAGRDGEFVNCISFYDDEDFETHEVFDLKTPEKREKREKATEVVRDFIEEKSCRRQFILNYFEQKLDSNNRKICCDNCLKDKLVETGTDYVHVDDNGNHDFTEDVRLLLSLVYYTSGRYGIVSYANILRGNTEKKFSYNVKIPLHGAGRHRTEHWWRALGDILKSERLLVEKRSSDNEYAWMLQLTHEGTEFLFDSKRRLISHLYEHMLTYYNNKRSFNEVEIPYFIPFKKTKMYIDTNLTETPEQLERRMIIYRLLLKTRCILSIRENCMPHIITSNKVCMKMAYLKPGSIEEMEKINLDGFTATKLSKFGTEFLKTILINQNVQSISRHLEKWSLQDEIKSSITPSEVVSLNLLQLGKSMQEIATLREFNDDFVRKQLCLFIQLGFEIKLSEFGITKNIEEKIIDAIFKDNSGLTLLPSILLACRGEITEGQVKALLNYLEVRDYLTSNKLIYEEFDDAEYFELYKKQQPKNKARELQGEGSINEDSSNLDENEDTGEEPLSKKLKVNM